MYRGIRVSALSVAILALSATGVSAADIEGWKELKSKDFKAELPGTSRHAAKDIKTAAGTITLHIYQTVTKQGLFFAVMHSDYPSEVVALKGTKRALDGARDGAVRNVGGKLLSEKKIKIGEHPGREFRFSAKRNGITLYGAWRLYIVDSRLYQLGIVSPFKEADQKDVKRFFNSFELVTAEQED